MQQSMKGEARFADSSILQRRLSRLNPWRDYLERVDHGVLLLRLPSGRELIFGKQGDEPVARLEIRDLRTLYSIFAHGEVGFLRSYMNGSADTPDLIGLLSWAALNAAALGPMLDANRFVRLLHRLSRRLLPNTVAKSRRNSAFHYDLGNDFYELWLDASMTYSSAMFGMEDESLEQAQLRKFRKVAECAGVRAGCEVLEIGCGWGGLARHLAREYQAQVTAVTLSVKQHDYLCRRIFEEGLSDRVRVVVSDFRKLDGTFDCVLSIEMFEAVGERYWATYFRELARRLKPGARAAIETITISEDRFETYRVGTDLMRECIFPGGMLPSPQRFAALSQAAGLERLGGVFFGKDYALTLNAWRRRFAENQNEIARLGFDEAFLRKWNLYLAYCEVGFRVGPIDVALFSLRRPA